MAIFAWVIQILISQYITSAIRMRAAYSPCYANGGGHRVYYAVKRITLQSKRYSNRTRNSKTNNYYTYMY